VKKTELLKRLRKLAKGSDNKLVFVREGKAHEHWSIGPQRLIIPRHNEINEHTAAGIIKVAREATDD